MQYSGYQKKKKKISQLLLGVVAQAYNPSCLRAEDQEDYSSRPA
jgi:hypothetical protein